MDMQQISIFGKPVWSEQTLTVNGREIPATQNGWQLLRTNTSLPMTLSSSMPWQIGFINIERPGRGVTVSAMGINGAQLSQWSKWRPGMWEDLAQTKADLIILAYGTNEAFSGNLDISSTEQTWRNYIRQIKNTLPNAGILILGAPESLKTAYGSCGNRPVLLSEIQQMQQRVARDEKIMFWSWQDAMGGACSMKNWMAQGLAAKDGVHFSAQGYETAADKLADSLIRFAQ
jgi:putative lipoprotein